MSRAVTVWRPRSSDGADFPERLDRIPRCLATGAMSGCEPVNWAQDFAKDRMVAANGSIRSSRRHSLLLTNGSAGELMA